MKKNYQTPTMNFTVFYSEDITTSAPGNIKAVSDAYFEENASQSGKSYSGTDLFNWDNF